MTNPKYIARFDEEVTIETEDGPTTAKRVAFWSYGYSEDGDLLEVNTGSGEMWIPTKHVLEITNLYEEAE
ncbi:hypothetical protein [Natronobacterium texcoconense]|uniref:Uncharacterized protein n=1 Tax=Natronobacterium texcoconense TaxID=1095778 RepID=A0A1H1FYM0_NATTX|nr:hypothetical protein [Natronobacterium texcoconense]SDR06094.1 hypothetical protein SAMN04489842_2177 [Natronobacterium texcoconense]